MDRLSDFLAKHEEVEVAGIINPIGRSVPNQILRRVHLSKEKSIIMVNPSDIIYLEAQDGKVSVVTNTERYLSHYSLNYWEQELEELFFFRCHKSYIVNLERIKEIIPFFDNTYIIKFEGFKDEVTVSRSYIKNFRQILCI